MILRAMTAFEMRVSRSLAAKYSLDESLRQWLPEWDLRYSALGRASDFCRKRLKKMSEGLEDQKVLHNY